MEEYEDYMEQDVPETLLFETEYFDGNPVRIYQVDDYWQSASYIEENMRFELVFNYMKAFDRAFEHVRTDADILLIGGAGYSYPKHIIAHYPEARITVLDNDPQAEQAARSYFFLDELIEQYDLNNSRRLVSVTADGREYLDTTDRRYDLVINDAFNGGTPVFDLCTLEALQSAKQTLHENGMLVVNVPGYRDTEESYFLMDISVTAKQVFEHVLIIPAPAVTDSETCNYVMFASDSCSRLSGMIAFDDVQGRILYDKDLQKIEDTFVY